ncbi:MAG: hypothetical protein M0Z36_03255, partial [Thermaerobacter sp.]|nr:hypothetical protein [Thermaerobacter sp.]
TWRAVVVGENGRVSKKAYTFWVLFRMLELMPSHDLYVTPSERYGDPRSQLLVEANLFCHGFDSLGCHYPCDHSLC